MKINLVAGKINNVYNGEVINISEGITSELKTQEVIKRDLLKVFISYAHKDEDIKNQLDYHLSALKRNERIITWNDRQIVAGEEWDTKIKSEINSADLILLLISSHFIASDYIWNFELANALKRQSSGNAIVIPIFCKPCDYTNMPFAKLQGLPKDAIPISTAANIDVVLTEVVAGITAVVEKFLK